MICPAISTVIADYNAGKRDRKAGYYDKWYRWNRSDNGYAYDEGTKDAVLEGCGEDFSIIECMH